MTNYNFNNLDELIRSGASPEDIANAFTANLNRAIAENDKVSRKEELCAEMAELWNEYVNLWMLEHPVPDEWDLHMSADDLAVSLDHMLTLFVKTAPLMEAMTDLADVFEPRSVNMENAKTKKNDYDSVMGNFLSKYCR